jgi:ribosomal protein S18 acetylase RimI-like enzyme
VPLTVLLSGRPGCGTVPPMPDAHALPFTVRRGRPADAATLTVFNTQMALETEAVTLRPDVIGPGVAAALADATKAIYFVAEVGGAAGPGEVAGQDGPGGRVVGQLMITHEWSDWRNGDIWWVQSVYVHPNFRRRGLFRALYDHARAEAKAAGAVGLRLYVETNNAAAQSTYRQLGMAMTHYHVMEEMWADGR